MKRRSSHRKILVDDSNDDSDKYDVIIGRNLTTALGMNLLFSVQQIMWDGATIPMRDPNTSTKKKLKQLKYCMIGSGNSELPYNYLKIVY